MSSTCQSDSKTRLLLAAGPVFAEKGFQGATVREICETAQVNIASVNYHFGDKESLYVETVRRARQMRAEQYPMPEWPAGTPAEVRLRQFIKTMVERMLAEEETPWQLRLLMREVLEPTEACRQLVNEYFRPQMERMHQMLRELAPHVSDAMLHKIGFSIIGQCFYYRVSRQIVELLETPERMATEYGPAQIAEHVATFSLAALGVVTPYGQWQPEPPGLAQPATQADNASPGDQSSEQSYDQATGDYHERP